MPALTLALAFRAMQSKHDAVADRGNNTITMIPKPLALYKGFMRTLSCSSDDRRFIDTGSWRLPTSPRLTRPDMPPAPVGGAWQAALDVDQGRGQDQSSIKSHSMWIGFRSLKTNQGHGRIQGRTRHGQDPSTDSKNSSVSCRCSSQ